METLDTQLYELRRVEIQIAAAEAQRELALVALEEDHRKVLEPLRAQREQLLGQVFEAARRLPVGQGASGTHGEVQHKTLPAHVELDRPDEEMVSVLLAAGQFGAVNEVRTINRQALQRLPEATLAELGVRLVERRQLVVRLPSGTRHTRELP